MKMNMKTICLSGTYELNGPLDLVSAQDVLLDLGKLEVREGATIQRACVRVVGRASFQMIQQMANGIIALSTELAVAHWTVPATATE